LPSDGVVEHDELRLGRSFARGSAERRGFYGWLDGGWPLNKRRRQAYAAGTQSQRTATEQAGPQAGAKLGPPIIVTFHNLEDAASRTFLPGLRRITRSSDSGLNSRP